MYALVFFFITCLLSRSVACYEFVCVSAPIVDHLIFVSDDFLKKISAKKGGAWSIEYSQFVDILGHFSQVDHIVLGGSGTNVTKGLASFGHDCAVIGKTGDDASGQWYKESLIKKGITPLFALDTKPTAQALCLITSDSQRTMRTFLGASSDFSDLSISEEDLKNTKLLHLEGYLLRNTSFLLDLIAKANRAGVKISFDCACFEIVQAYRDTLLSLIKNRAISVLFANEEETFTLTRSPPETAVEFLSEYCDVVAITLGEKGSLCGKGKEMIFQPAIAAKAIDTTGAGDLYASGFLHGYLSNCSLKECAFYGTFVASKVVEVVGAELSEKQWMEVSEKIPPKNGLYTNNLKNREYDKETP